jgi:hypothetical protein
MQKIKIGFFGDSFCAERTNHHSLVYRYNTYMDLLLNHYNADLANVGKGGSSIYDTVLLQLKPFIDTDTVPDICVFVWTNSGRLFNRKVRHINHTSALNFKLGITNFFTRHIWSAAKQYYEQLYDHEQVELEYVAMLNYIDNAILTQLPNKTKIIHLWSFGTADWQNKKFNPSSITYPYTWKTGVEIRPALVSLSLYDNDIETLSTDHRCNHLDGKFKNELLFSWIKQSIEESGQSLDYSAVIDTLYDKSLVKDHQAI